MSIGPLELFGTDEPQPDRRHLLAGPLSAVLEDGNLRDIRFGGVEIVRAINYLARDASWGTFKPALSNLRITQDENTFAVDYDGLCGEPGSGFAYTVRIRGEASGRLTMEADGTALADFLTNRTGFVILHAAEVAGARMSLIHSNGTREETFFPLRISADQPAFDIAAIAHEAAPGLSCTIEMEGDAFEMEDQRNWADASFKTYVRPLSKPRPYVIAKDTADRQCITVSVEGNPSTPDVSCQNTASLSLATPVTRMPDIALFVDESGLGTLSHENAPQILIIRLDPEKPDSAAELAHVAAFAKQSRTSVAIELVLSARDPVADAGEALRLTDSVGLQPSALLVSPRREFKTRPSHMLPDGEAPIDDLVAALRRAGFPGKIGAGTPSYFTEFNRNPPGTAGDFVFFSVAATVHAADDISVAETLPSILS
jgi:D-apionolactonase